MLGMTVPSLMYALLSLIIALLAAWAKAQESRIKELERFKVHVMEKWLSDAQTFVSKADFNALAQELKDSLHRIEDKIEKLRG